jgi:hypothetical protein
MVKLKVFVKELGPGTVYMGEKSDYWIIAQLENGMIIELFDYKCFAREIEVNSTIDCLILAFYADIVNVGNSSKKYDRARPILTGKFIGDYTIPEEWVNLMRKSIFPGRTTQYPAVKTENGLILLYFWKKPLDLHIGEVITFNEGRLDLLAWKPIEED